MAGRAGLGLERGATTSLALQELLEAAKTSVQNKKRPAPIESERARN